MATSPFIIIRGAPGAGKSTLAKQLQVEFGAASLHETDDFFVDPVTNKYKFNPRFLSAAHAWNQGEVIRSCRDWPDLPVIVANTMCQNWEIEAYLKIAGEFNRPVWIFTLLTKHDNVHGVPKDKVELMRLGVQRVSEKLISEYNIVSAQTIVADPDAKRIAALF